jgi:hypothetical protein
VAWLARPSTEEHLVYSRTPAPPASSSSAIMLLVTLGDFLADPKIAAHHIAK